MKQVMMLLRFIRSPQCLVPISLMARRRRRIRRTPGPRSCGQPHGCATHTFAVSSSQCPEMQQRQCCISMAVASLHEIRDAGRVANHEILLRRETISQHPSRQLTQRGKRSARSGWRNLPFNIACSPGSYSVVSAFDPEADSDRYRELHPLDVELMREMSSHDMVNIALKGSLAI